MSLLFRLLSALVLMLAAAPLAAQTFPPLSGRVVDGANLLSPEQEVDLTAKLATLETQSGRQLVVATLPSLEGRTIEDYGYRLGRAWKIGQEGEDDGVLLLVAPKERKLRIETGYGARVFLTDAVSGLIIRESITPRFKAGDYAGGISAGVGAISTMMILPPAEAKKRADAIGASEASRARGSNGGVGAIPVMFWVIIFFFVVLPMVRRASRSGRKYRRSGGGDNLGIILWGLSEGMRASSRGGGGGWGGGWGGGGGGFSGGGGSFGGGGASGGW